MAENEAIRRGCKHAHLDTMDWQALDFYLGMGYTLCSASSMTCQPDTPAIFCKKR